MGRKKSYRWECQNIICCFITKHSILSDNLWQVTVFYMPCPFKREKYIKFFLFLPYKKVLRQKDIN